MNRQAALALMLLAPFAASAATRGLTDCVALADDAARLTCYDRVAGRSVAPGTIEQHFGAESLPAPATPPDEPREIRARLVGTVEGWKRGTRFTLDNGQIWLCIDEREQYTRLDGVAVTIRRNFLGSYFLQVDGMNASARVRRVQ